MLGTEQHEDKLNIRNLKEWARTRLPLGSALRKILLREDDSLGVEEFLAKSDTWLKLAHIENS